MNDTGDPEHFHANGAASFDELAENAPRSAGDHARQIQHDANTLAAEVRRTTVDLERYLRDSVRHRPFTTLSVAAGVGYVLGGGLAARFTMEMLGLATRLAAALAVREIAARSQSRTASTNQTGA
jgi:ElaB/YqjD/DUF883 family membrane-anchored ribosome-binding protein